MFSGFGSGHQSGNELNLYKDAIVYLFMAVYKKI